MSVQQLFDLDGRNALVTGGSRGLGLQMAEALGELGARVALTARKRDELDQAVDHLRKRGIHAVAVPCDMSDAAAIAPAVAQRDRGARPDRHPRQQCGDDLGRGDGRASARCLAESHQPQPDRDVRRQPGSRQALHGAAAKGQDHQRRLDPRAGRRRRSRAAPRRSRTTPARAASSISRARSPRNGRSTTSTSTPSHRDSFRRR